MTSYLKQRKGRSGWFFQRAVPLALQDRLGRTWVAKAGNTKEEASREALRLLGLTDKIITICRHEPSAVIRLQDVANAETIHVSDMGDNEMIDTLDVIDQRFVKTKVEQYVENEFDTIIERIKLKASPSASTIRGWKTEYRLFSEQSGCKSFNAVTHEKVEQYIEYLISTCNTHGSFKTKYNRLKTVNKYAQAYKMVDEIYFDAGKIMGVKINRGPRGIIKETKCLDISPADEYFALNKIGKVNDNFDTYIRTHWCMRWTIAHVGEIEGLTWEDIDLSQNRTLSIQANELRELKTRQRGRILPIIPPLYDLLMDMYSKSATKSGSIFNKHATLDWGASIRNHYQKVNLSPKSCRDYGSGLIQSKFGDQDRRVKMIHGHGKSDGTSTADYGDIKPESLLPMMELLM